MNWGKTGGEILPLKNMPFQEIRERSHLPIKDVQEKGRGKNLKEHTGGKVGPSTDSKGRFNEKS